MNNNGYFSIRQTQRKFFGGNLVGEGPNSKVPMPSLDKIAEAFELDYIKLSNIQQLENKIDSILSSDRPIIIEVCLKQDIQIIPTNAAKLNDDGTMTSKPLEDMYPYLDREEFLENMLVTPVNE